MRLTLYRGHRWNRYKILASIIHGLCTIWRAAVFKVSRADFSGVAAHPYDALVRGKSSDQRVLGGNQSKAKIEFGAVLARQLDVERVGRDANMHQRALDQGL